MKCQDFTFTRQKVVFNIEAIHGFEMAPQNGNRNYFRKRGSLVPALLDVMKSLRAKLQVLFVCLVPLGYASVEIPAVIIESWCEDELFDCFTGVFLYVQKTNHNVGDLHACVVDIVLDIHFPSRKAQQPNKRVTEDCIAKVADVSSLVRVNAGVLD